MPEPTPLPPALEAALAPLRPRWDALAVPPGALGVVLGSGLGDAAEEFPRVWERDFPSLGLPATGVAGHRGRLILAEGPAAPLLFLQGRLHRYEGLADARVLLPVAAMAGLGLAGLLVTNAAGGIDPAFAPGDFMLVEDVLSFQFADPLRGLRGDAALRRPPRRPLYDRALADSLVAAAREAAVTLHAGTLACAPGPAYETRAENRMAKETGARAASMSTFPESMLLAHLNVPSVALSCITNAIPEGDGAEPLTHAEVVEAAGAAAAGFARLLAAWRP